MTDLALDPGARRAILEACDSLRAEAEQVLMEHPQVSDCAVIGVPHPEMGEEVLALVVPVHLDDPPRPEELIALCRARLAGYKCPRSVAMALRP